MKEMSIRTTEATQPKTLIVFNARYESEIIPHIKRILSSSEQRADTIYVSVNCTKGCLKFTGMEHCSIIGS